VKYFGLIWAGLYRKPIRTFLTLASVFVAFLLFGLLQSVSRAFEAGVDMSGADRLVVAPKYSIIDLIPLSYSHQIQQVPGVENIAHRTWFGGTYKDPANFFPRWPVPPKEFLEIYTEYVLPPEQKQAFLSIRTGAIAGRSIADKYEWKVGDKIPLIPDIWENKDGGPWVFDLVGIYEGIDETISTEQMFINYEYFDEYRPFEVGAVGNLILKISDPDQSAAIAARVDAMFANSSNETKTSTEKAYNQMFAKQMGDIGFIMTAILSAVFFTIILLTGNTMAQAIRERIPELAILKTIGFTNQGVLLIVIAESVLLSLLGGILGLAAATMMIPGLSASIPFFIGLEMNPVTFVTGVCVAIALGIVVGLMPAIRAMRLNIVDAIGEHA
jgi:putative ABC transport system permease protein